MYILTIPYTIYAAMLYIIYSDQRGRDTRKLTKHHLL